MQALAHKLSWFGNFINGNPVLKQKIVHCFRIMDEEKNNNSEIIFLADTQAPIWVETLVLKNRGNIKATEIILKDILERKPQSLFILGDLVSLGYLNSAWKLIDKYVAKMKQEKIPVHAIMGNHELMARYRTGERNFQKRFPEHIRTGYCRIVDSIAVVMLNSNFSRLSLPEQKLQDDWYHHTLSKLEDDHNVKAIIVGTHHPPYTNSLLVASSREVQQKFVPPYVKCRKTLLFLTGHCHAFEYFKSEEKDFLVIGGGGGLQHPLNKKTGRYDDLADKYKPFFHYLAVKRSDDRMRIISRQLKDDFSGFEENFSFEVNLCS